MQTMRERDTRSVGRRWTGRDGHERNGGSGIFKSRKGFGYDIRKANARPGNKVFLDAVLTFLKDTKVAMIKEGVLGGD